MENKLVKILLIFLSILLILIGLFGAFCGGFFTLTFLTGGGGGYEIYPLSIGSIIIGIIFIFGGYKGFKKILNGNNNEKKVSDVKETEL